MKHPHLSVLQDYFENELNAVQTSLLKEHLINCDVCTGILSQIAKVDTSVKSIAPQKVSPVIRAKIFVDAKQLLVQKRLALEEEIQVALNRVQARDEMVRATTNLWKEMLIELRLPALQLASVSIMVAVIIAANRDEQTTIHKPFPEDVIVTTRTGDFE